MQRALQSNLHQGLQCVSVALVAKVRNTTTQKCTKMCKWTLKYVYQQTKPIGKHVITYKRTCKALLMCFCGKIIMERR